MAKFAEVEKFQSKKLDEASSAAGTDKENRESNAALTEEELQQALHVDPNVVPVNAEVPQENVRRRCAYTESVQLTSTLQSNAATLVFTQPTLVGMLRCFGVPGPESWLRISRPINRTVTRP
eukprot:5300060-Pyramimonas_sp.AAC.1